MKLPLKYLAYITAALITLSCDGEQPIVERSSGAGSGDGSSEETKEFSLLNSDIFEMAENPDHSVFTTNKYLFLSSEKGESSFVTLSDSSVSKKPVYEYLDANEIGLRYGAGLWVLSNGSISRYEDIEASSDRLEGSAESLKDVTFDQVYYVDLDRVIILKEDKIVHVYVKDGALVLDTVGSSVYGKISGTGITSNNQIWIIDSSGVIKTINDSELKSHSSLPKLPESGKVKGYLGESLESTYVILEGESKTYTIGALAKDLGGSGVYDWVKVKEFSDLYCVACHSEDGFESESTWLDTKKASILRTLKNGTMPKAGSSQAEKMLLSEAEAVIAWLEADGAPVEEEPDSPTPSPDKPANTAIIPDGVLAVVENKCISCHATINKYGYWYSNSFNIKAEVESGNMPKNGSLTESQKKAILDFVKVVEAY